MEFFTSQEHMLQWFKENIFTKSGSCSSSRFNEHWFVKRKFDSQWRDIKCIQDEFNFSNVEFLYRLKNLIPWDKVFLCKKCGKPVKFHQTGYSTTCSIKCSMNLEETKCKIQETTLKHFGVKCSLQSKDVREKGKQTCLEKYGVENPNKSKEVKAKIRQTNLKRYGVSTFTQTAEYKEKVKQTCLEKYNVEHHTQAKEVKDKIVSTNVTRYGVKCTLQADEFKEKRKVTWLENYGVENPWQSKEIRDKIIQTCLEKYGVKNPLQSKEIYKKLINTNMEKYGYPCSFQSEKVRNVYKKNFLEKCGVENPSQLEEIKEKKRQTCLNHFGVEYSYQSPKVQQKMYETMKRNGTFNTSKTEQNILQKLKEKFPDTQYQYVSKEYPWRCDFYIPSLDLYIEYQGMWTHGKEPFDENNLEHLKIIQEWKEKSKEINWQGKTKFFYERAIDGWTIGDVEKRNWAKEHNLNFLEFFNEESFNKWFDTINKKR